MKKSIALIICSCLSLTFLASCAENVTYEPYAPKVEIGSNKTIARDVNGGDLILAENNQTNYSIVIPEDADIYENWGAADLKNFLGDSTGADFEIVSDKGLVYSSSNYLISIGETRAFDAVKQRKGIDLTQSKYGQTGGVICQDGNSLFLVGNGGYGTLNSIYEFLAKQIDFEAYSTDEISISYSTKAFMYEYGVQDVIYKTEYRVPEFGKIISASSFGPAARMGIMSAANGGTMLDGSIYAKYLHTLEGMIPKNPGWWNNGQPCLTNEEVIAHVAEESKKYILREPAARYIMYGGKDNASTCNCDECSRMSLEAAGAGGVMIYFCNRISEILEPWLEEQGRDITFLALAYLGYETAPATYDYSTDTWTVIPGYEARDNVGVFLCFPNGDYGHGLDDPTSTTNVGELRKLKAWASVTKHICVYLYDSNYSSYMAYCNAVSSYSGWARALQSHGVELVYHDVVYNNVYSTFSDLKMYLISKLDKDATAYSQTELTKDFCEHYYKDASADMYKLYDDIRMHHTSISAVAGSQDLNCYDNGVKYSDAFNWPINVFDSLLATVKSAYEKIDNSVLNDETKALVNVRIMAEEFHLRYLNYTYNKSYFTTSARKSEEDWLTSASKILGFDRTGETSGSGLKF